MKKLFMAVAVMLLVGSIVKAQKLEFGDKDEYIRYESSLLGMDENNYYVLVGYSQNKKDNYKGSVLYTYDKNLKIVDKTNIDDAVGHATSFPRSLPITNFRWYMPTINLPLSTAML